MSKQAYTTGQAAAELGVTPARVRQMVLDGLLPAEKFGRDLAISADGIALARQRKTAPGPKPKVKPEPSGKKKVSVGK